MALLTQLKLFQILGCFVPFPHTPPSVVEHIVTCLGCPDAGALHYSKNTFYRHQVAVRHKLGVAPWGPQGPPAARKIKNFTPHTPPNTIQRRKHFPKGCFILPIPAISEQDMRLHVVAYSKAASLHAGFEYYRAFEQDAADNANDHTPPEMPVFALGGDHSPWKTYLYEQLQGNAISLEGAVVPECGHFIPEERPEWLAEHVRQFLDPTIRRTGAISSGGW